MADAPWTTILENRFRNDRELRKLGRRLCGLEDRLRNLVTQDAWAIYLKVDEVETRRLCRMINVAAEEGVRRGNRGRK